MNDQRTSYGTEDKCSSVQKIRVQTVIRLLMRKTGPNAQCQWVLWQACRLEEIWVDFEIFKIFYRLKYFIFYFVNITTILFIVLEVHFSQFISYFRACFVVCKIQLPFFNVDPYYQVLAYLMITQLIIPNCICITACMAVLFQLILARSLYSWQTTIIQCQILYYQGCSNQSSWSSIGWTTSQLAISQG